MDTAWISTPLGNAIIKGDEKGICAISIHESNEVQSSKIPPLLEVAIAEITEYFSGTRNEFTFPINPTGTAFQQKVWKALLEIPYGRTMSYLELSKQLGDVKAIRAVASANGKNPLWIVVPCHRVIGTDGSLTGYAGGLWRKKWLLEHENPTSQQSLF